MESVGKYYGPPRVRAEAFIKSLIHLEKFLRHEYCFMKATMTFWRIALKSTLLKWMPAVALGLVFCSVSQAATVIHDYKLNGDLTDIYGGPSLVSLGGSLSSAPGSYTFGANQGLRLTGGLNNTQVWSLDFKANYASLANTWKKLVDFQNLTTDKGLYFSNYGAGDRLEYWPHGTGPATVNTNVDYTIALTRDASNVLRGYVNGALQWSIADENDSISAANILTFFTDDFATGQREAQGGSVDFIRIYDGVLTADEVTILDHGGTVGVPGNRVPEPASVGLLAAGMLGMLAVRRRQRKQR